jgi:nucleoside-diphosphate-sugar epimerase
MSDGLLHPQGGSLALVTGGAGFIGSTLVDSLLGRGCRVRVLDNLETGSVQYLDLGNPNLELVVGDIEDMNTVTASMRDVSLVFHLGAASKVAPSLKSPEMGRSTIITNVVGTNNVLHAAVQSGTVRKFIYAGSSTYYGNQNVPFTESAPFVSSSPYALSKYMGEMLCQMYDELYNLPSINLRLFMVYGPRQPRTGDYAVVTGKFIDQMNSGMPLTIQGSGENFRDFVHVNDVVNALILASESEHRAVTINIGSGRSYSVKEVADLISPRQIHLPPRAHDLKGTLADICLAEQLLGYAPLHDFVSETLKMAKAPHKDYKNPFWRQELIRKRVSNILPGCDSWDAWDFDRQNEYLKELIMRYGFTTIKAALLESRD